MSYYFKLIQTQDKENIYSRKPALTENNNKSFVISQYTSDLVFRGGLISYFYSTTKNLMFLSISNESRIRSHMTLLILYKKVSLPNLMQPLYTNAKT